MSRIHSRHLIIILVFIIVIIVILILIIIFMLIIISLFIVVIIVFFAAGVVVVVVFFSGSPDWLQPRVAPAFLSCAPPNQLFALAEREAHPGSGCGC